ncbi:copper resistance CopC family protein [Acidobacterium sp. S8]|uniref:copper resistance CopC family protein n=1 Tax=Acidobacterium sp. S8 TaxID=1641854 RepID=UPI00131CD1CF|nr:copper resistance CopC family protein [Acidobacterium sp. S8]
MKAVRFPRHLLLAILLSVIVLTPKLAMAHAVLVASTPSAHASIRGPEITVQLKFNSRIDGEHSRLYLVDSTGKSQTLTLTPQSAPDILAAQSVKVSAGGYTIRWQALASDGHITRGEIPFVVQ